MYIESGVFCYSVYPHKERMPRNMLEIIATFTCSVVVRKL